MLGPPKSRARCLLALGRLLRWEHEFVRTGAAAREAHAISADLGDEEASAEAANAEGLVAANLGDYAGGALERARQTLGEAAYAAAWAEGQALTLEQAVAYALKEAQDDA